MKRILCLLTALCLLASVPAMAEAVGSAPLTPAADEALVIDLDGDGASETVRWEMKPGDYDSVLTLTVASEGGASATYATDIIWAGEVYVVDLDKDGAQEILLSGDVMSDDYCTVCLRWDGAALYELLFPDGSRADSNTEGYFKQCYGRVDAVGDNLITLSGSQDILGTWFATRTLTLSPYDRFEFNDAGLWLRSLDSYEGADDDLWEYAALTVTQPLPYADEHHHDQVIGTLQPGDRILIYASDKREVACFATPDGASGALAIEPDYEQGWGWLVDGIPEDECFENVPYAD